MVAGRERGNATSHSVSLPPRQRSFSCARYCSRCTVAVKRVTENRGKRTPGVDGKIWSTPVQVSAQEHGFPMSAT
nr:reverse transcriptase N-terminal domain-containing protein [Pseudomonas borbori]